MTHYLPNDGETIYGKPLPLDADPWGADAVDYSALASTDLLSAELDDATDYLLFAQAGESPAATDECVGEVVADGGGGSGGATAEEISDYFVAATGDAFTEKVAEAVSAELSGITSVSIVSPIAADGTTITVVQGDDYSGSNAITWMGDAADQWPDLTDATLSFRATQVGALPITGTPAVTTPTGTQVFSMELSSTDTDRPVGRYRYDVEATLADESVRTLLRGVMVVTRTYTNEP